MRIVIVIDSWNRGNGGIVVTHTLVNELKSRGHEISLVTTDGKEATEYNGTVNVVSGFYLPGMKQSMQNMGFLFGRGKKKTLRKAYQGADIVHIIFPFFMSRNAAKVAIKMNIPVIAGSHIQTQNMSGSMGKDNKAMDWFFRNWFNYQLFNRVKAIHCPSELAADILQANGNNSHLRVISNGIPKEFVPMDNAQRLDLFEDKFVILNIGRHAMEKKQESIIDAVLQSKYKDDIKLLICGKGETSEKLKERGKELPVEPLINYVSEEEKLLFLNIADLYLHSSSAELESRSCLEAIGCGLPCLIEDSPTSAASQFAYDERFIFETKNLAAMTAKIDYWYENRAKLSKMKEPILQFAEKYRIDNAITAMEEFYDDVIKEHDGAEGLIPEGEKIIAGDIKSKPEIKLPIDNNVELSDKDEKEIIVSQPGKLGS